MINPLVMVHNSESYHKLISGICHTKICFKNIEFLLKKLKTIPINKVCKINLTKIKYKRHIAFIFIAKMFQKNARFYKIHH